MTKKREEECPQEEPMMVNDPTIGYGFNRSNEILEYEEDLAESLSSEELKKNMFQYIDNLFKE